MDWAIGMVLMFGLGAIAYVLLEMSGKIEEVSHHDDEHDEHETSSV